MTNVLKTMSVSDLANLVLRPQAIPGAVDPCENAHTLRKEAHVKQDRRHRHEEDGNNGKETRMNMTQRTLLTIAFAAVVMMLSGTGCTTQKASAPATVFIPPPATDGVLAAGDELDIKFYYAPELNERQIIRPDGMITLQLVGDVKAADLTPSGLEKVLQESFKTLIDRNEVAVIVRRFFGRVVYVGGAVMRPRSVEMPGNLTVMAAVMEAGGLDYQSAAPKMVLVMRESCTGYQTFKINLEDRLEGRDRAPFYLQPRDIVYVSRSRIADANQWVDQHINRLLPRVGFTVFNTQGNTTIGVDTSQ